MAAVLTEQQVRAVREQIVAIAERQIAAKGPDALSMRVIAAEIGWTAASLYRYFPSKGALLEAVRIGAYDRFSDAIEAAHDSTGDLWDRSRAIGDAYVAFALNEPAAYQLIFQTRPDPRECRSPQMLRAHERISRTLTSYVRELVVAGELEGDADLIAHSYWAAMHGLIQLRLAGLLEDSPSFDKLRHAAARMITRGARPGA